MEFFRDTNIDFMKYRKIWIWFSMMLILLGVFSLFVHGKLNLGIDFAGGTQLTVKFRDQPEVERLRQVLAAAGIEDAQIQRFGAEGDHEVIIKTPTVEGKDEGSRADIVAALNAELGSEAGKLDLNEQGTDALASLLLERDPDEVRAGDEDLARAHYQGIAEVIMARRQEVGVLASWDELSGVAGVTPQIVDILRSNTQLGAYSVVGSENVGPLIGAELRKKGVLAVVFSLIGMLIYVWFRFELRFGIGALIAVAHDVFVTLGLFSLAGLEFNLTTIAAFLTLIGYSVNDTVVIFDRVRENMRRQRRARLVDVFNTSLNQTLSRSVLTSGTTLLALVTLLIYGGDAMRGFAFILTVGVVTGTYSSIYIASPFALLWESFFGSEARRNRRATV